MASSVGVVTLLQMISACGHDQMCYWTYEHLIYNKRKEKNVERNKTCCWRGMTQESHVPLPISLGKAKQLLFNLVSLKRHDLRARMVVRTQDANWDEEIELASNSNSTVQYRQWPSEPDQLARSLVNLATPWLAHWSPIPATIPVAIHQQDG